jgi:hypothetical protein
LVGGGGGGGDAVSFASDEFFVSFVVAEHIALAAVAVLCLAKTRTATPLERKRSGKVDMTNEFKICRSLLDCCCLRLVSFSFILVW